jgi:hypothetical protein
MPLPLVATGQVYPDFAGLNEPGEEICQDVRGAGESLEGFEMATTESSPRGDTEKENFQHKAHKEHKGEPRVKRRQMFTSEAVRR